VLDGGEWLASRRGCFTPGETAHDTLFGVLSSDFIHFAGKNIFNAYETFELYVPTSLYFVWRNFIIIG